MTLPGNTPVLIGVGAVRHRPDDGPTPEPLDLLARAAAEADADHGGRSLLAELGWIGVPKGSWTHPDPARALADRWSASGCHTLLAEVGVLQSTVIAAAVAAVQAGAGPALVVGGEAAHGGSDGAASAVAAALVAGGEPDEHLMNPDFGVADQEITRGMIEAPAVYAVLEQAWRKARGQDRTTHRRLLGELGQHFARVAADHPTAWTTDAPDAGTIVTPTPDNRMVADPYTKLCCSNLRVNQAAALLITTVDHARQVGVPEDRWVHPLASADNNHSVPVIARPELHRVPGFGVAAGAAADHAGIDLGALAVVDLYSCFPAAVRIAADELGLADRTDWTVTGGMTFGGGPLNSYLLHATAAIARELRDRPGGVGLTTAVSGFLTKQGVALWSSEPPARPWQHGDVSEAVAVQQPALELTDDHHGTATVVSGTLVHDRAGPHQVVAVLETPTGARTAATSTHDAVLASFGGDGEFIGTTVDLAGDTFRLA